MAVLDVQGLKEKDSTVSLVLSKTDLKANAKIQQNSYYLQEENWDKLSVIYESSDTNQQEILLFDISQENPSVDLFLSNSFVGDLIFKKIMIIDKKLGSLSLERSDFTQVESDSFDILFS